MGRGPLLPETEFPAADKKDSVFTRHHLNGCKLVWCRSKLYKESRAAAILQSIGPRSENPRLFQPERHACMDGEHGKCPHRHSEWLCARAPFNAQKSSMVLLAYHRNPTSLQTLEHPRQGCRCRPLNTHRTPPWPHFKPHW